MQMPSIAVALALSLAAGVATVRFAIAPPMDHADTVQLRSVAEACEGYDMLHVLLGSAHAADEFRRNGHCMEKLSQGQFGRQR